MVQEHGKRKHKPLTQNKAEEAESKVILTYSDQLTAEVRSSQEIAKLLGEDRNQQGMTGKQSKAL